MTDLPPNASPKIRDSAESDRPGLVALTNELQDYLKAIDPLQRLLRAPDYGERYAAMCLEGVQENDGTLLVAEVEGAIVGYIAGVIDRESADVGLSYVETKAGRITEFVVTEEARASGVGARLVEALEAFFREKACDLARVEVFAPNDLALRFYEGRGYHIRIHEMTRLLS